MFGAPQVIGHRTARRARAGRSPSRNDQLEFTAMGREKIAAFSQAWTNVAGEIVTFQQQIANAAMRHWWVMANVFNPLTVLTAPWSLLTAPIDLL